MGLVLADLAEPGLQQESGAIYTTCQRFNTGIPYEPSSKVKAQTDHSYTLGFWPTAAPAPANHR
jgi:hypothetical protein